MLFKRRYKVGCDEYVWGKHAAAVFGVSSVTFYHKFRANKLGKINAIKTPGGVKYCLRDVVKAAHPYATKDEIDEITKLHSRVGSRLKIKKIRNRKKRG